MIEEQRADVAQPILDIHCDVAVFAQRRHQIGQRLLQPIDLAVLQRGRGSRRVGDGDPFDTVCNDLFAAGKPGRWLRSRHVAVEFLEHGFGARRPFVLDEAHGPAADIFIDLLERIGGGDPCRHDEAARRDDLAERQQHLRIGLLQRPAEGAIVESRKLVLDRLDHLAHGIASGPSIDAGHGICGTHRLAVMELERLPQPKGPDEAVR